jgi:hypothetical protein
MNYTKELKTNLKRIIMNKKHGCHADGFRRTDGRSDDGRGGVRDLDAL